jgi:hypothetical protein
VLVLLQGAFYECVSIFLVGNAGAETAMDEAFLVWLHIEVEKAEKALFVVCFSPHIEHPACFVFMAKL